MLRLLGFATVEGGSGIAVDHRRHRFANSASTGITISNTSVTGFGTGINAVAASGHLIDLTLDDVTACGNSRGIGIRANGAQVLGGNVGGSTIDGIQVFAPSSNVLIDGVNFDGNLVDVVGVATVQNSTNIPFNCPAPGAEEDTTPPTITAPADVTVEATSLTGQAVAIGTATATDDEDPAPVITNDAPALFLLGTTEVTWTATDESGNLATTTQDVTVQDTTAPTPVHSGPFSVDEGSSIQLDGTGSTDNLAVQSTAWDIDGDGFDDGDPATFNGIDGPSTHDVVLQVIDHAGNVSTTTTTVTVNNVAPEFDGTTFFGTATTFTSGDDAFIGRLGVPQTHSVSASDMGSDDLEYDWAFPGTPDRFGGTLPPNLETDEDLAEVTFNAPGIYTVQVTVTDDSGATDYQELPKLVTDACDCVEHQQWWEKQYKERKPNDQKKVDKGELLTEEALQAYLDVVAFASSRFGEDVALLTLADARNVFSPPKAPNGGTGSGSGGQNNDGSRSGEGVTGSGSGSGKKKNKKDKDSGGGDSASGSGSGTGANLEKKRQDATQVTLAAWLNFAKGGILWDEDVVVEKGTGTGAGSTPVVVMPFNEIVAEVEAILNNPDATGDDIHRAKKLAESINKHDNGNKDCETGSGSGSGVGSGSGSGDDSDTGSGNGRRRS